MSAITWIFFDIGGTLGERDPATGRLVPYPSTKPFLVALRQLGLRLGVITTLGPLTNAQGKALLQQAGLAEFIGPVGFISEHDVNGTAKPDPGIYQRAAQQANVPMERCLFVGENLLEVLGARAAGMQGQLKPTPPGKELTI